MEHQAISSKDSLLPIPAKRYFTIGEVSELCGVKPHVLRYWEQEFTQLKPVKRRGNRRYYQHHEVLLIRRIREFVKRSEPRRRPTPAARVVEDSISFAEIEAAKRGIAIRTHLPPNMPPLDVDPILIEQLLLNLLKNAVEAMEGAQVRVIDLVVRRMDDMAEFSVIDRGTGVPEAQRASLFQPFFSTKSEGMGMGLNICRSIVEFHHGRLTVEENPEGGSIFRFTLPLAREQAVNDNPPA
jgi:signal transduction histidine kinase